MATAIGLNLLVVFGSFPDSPNLSFSVFGSFDSGSGSGTEDDLLR